MSHLPLSLTLLLFTVVAVKIVVVSHGSLPTALALVNTAGPAEVVLSVMITELPTVLLTLFMLTVVLLPTKDVAVSVSMLLLVLLLVAGFFMMPATEFILTVSAILIVVVFRIVTARTPFGHLHPGWKLMLGCALLAPTSALLSQTVMSDGMWLPPEEVLIGSSDSYVGYVLDSDSEWTFILINDNRRVRQVPSSLINDRDLCILIEEPINLSVAGRLLSWETPDYGVCLH